MGFPEVDPEYARNIIAKINEAAADLERSKGKMVEKNPFLDLAEDWKADKEKLLDFGKRLEAGIKKWDAAQRDHAKTALEQVRKYLSIHTICYLSSEELSNAIQKVLELGGQFRHFIQKICDQDGDDSLNLIRNIIRNDLSMGLTINLISFKREVLELYDYLIETSPLPR